MPKKVSPEYFIQLSQRVNILHKKERKDLLKSPCEKDSKAYYWSLSEKGQGKIANKGQKTGYQSLYVY